MQGKRRPVIQGDTFSSGASWLGDPQLFFDMPTQEA